MTGFTTIFSALPLVIATGPGSESRGVIGIVVVSGVTFSLYLTLYIVPTIYAWVARNTGSPKHRAHLLANQMEQNIKHSRL